MSLFIPLLASPTRARAALRDVVGGEDLREHVRDVVDGQHDDKPTVDAQP